jgi:HSP20 family protein
MLMRSDPFRELDRLSQEAFATRSRPAVMPMDAYRRGDQFLVHFDLPGVDPTSIEMTVEKNVLTVSAHRDWQPGEEDQVVASERPYGTFTRQLFLGETLDTEQVEASYELGVLSVTIPMAEKAKPRRVEIGGSRNGQQSINANAHED